jgi:hypothetical protein
MTLVPEQHQFRSPLFESVVEIAVQFFINTPLQPLPVEQVFPGTGVYALYLLTHGGIYRDVADPNAVRPIYAGKAVAAGWRTARTSHIVPGRALFSRLQQHGRSIEQTQNLTLIDFRCRFMILTEIESDLIAPVEAAIIRRFRPLWNTTVDGFGNHDPGSGRYHQAMSEWDTLHPGRLWATRLTGNRIDREIVVAKIAAYIERLKENS